jgi:hypothetical protein
MTVERPPRPVVRTPAELVALRTKLSEGGRLSQYEANRMGELERWVTAQCHEEYDRWLAESAEVS